MPIAACIMQIECHPGSAWFEAFVVWHIESIMVVLLPYKPEKILVSINEGIYNSCYAETLHPVNEFCITCNS